MMRNNLFLVGMLLTVALTPSASAAELAEEQCGGPHLVECLLREADEFIDGAQDEVEDMCDSATGDCPIILAGIETSSGQQAAVVAACKDGETVAECAQRETSEFYEGLYDEAQEYCDDIVGNCPGDECKSETPLQCTLRQVREFIPVAASADASSATVAECSPGESVLECTIFEAFEECRRLLDNCPSPRGASCQPGETALQCLVRILTGGVWIQA